LQAEFDDNQETVDVKRLCQRCDSTKWNINKGNSSNHFASIGGSFGFGAQQSYHRKKNSASSMGHFSFKTKKEQEKFTWNKILLMEWDMPVL